MTVADGKVVVLHYTLRGEDGVVIESTDGKDPVAYLHGHKNLMPGMERALAGRAVGEKIRAEIAPAEAFGERRGPGPQEVRRKEFPRTITLIPGSRLRVPDSAGNPVEVWVTKVQGSRVWIDIDHPLAGRTLTFEAEVMQIRDPYAEELSHGHAHGAHGHSGH
jgi:FKBP-type peptidyl-prolyl cis-trans isomerase SlyD